MKSQRTLPALNNSLVLVLVLALALNIASNKNKKLATCNIRNVESILNFHPRSCEIVLIARALITSLIILFLPKNWHDDILHISDLIFNNSVSEKYCIFQ